jgi:flagellar hook-associated protein 2
MGISSAGIGSGLDVNSIVSSLMAIEQKPLTAVTKQKTAYQTQISAYGTMTSALSSFQTAVHALSTASSFNAQTVTSGSPSVFTATANGSSTIGNYAVTVSQLAASQKLASTGYANVTDVVGTGTMTISFGTFTPAVVSPATPASFTANPAKTDLTLTIDSSNNTLAGVRDAINALNSTVSATIVNNGTTNQLVITSKDTGEVNSLKISGLPQLAYDPTATTGNAMTQMQAAKNALLNIDGIAVTKASNTITDAISGVTLNLLSVSSGGVSANLGVTSNQSAVQTSVSAFVDAYNKLDTTMRNLTKFDPTGVASGVLLGDATARTAINQIKSVMTQAISSSGSLNTLSQIGVSFLATGQLALDTTKLTSALTNHFSDIATLFTTSAKATDPQITYLGSTSSTQAGTYAVTVSQLGTSLVNAAGTINGLAATSTGTNLVGAVGDPSAGLSINVAGGVLGARGTVNFSIGYATKLDSILTNLLGSSGIVTSRTDGINTSITRLNKQADTITMRLTAIEASYRAQYTKLDTLMSSMSTTSTFLTQQIASINANK